MCSCRYLNRRLISYLAPTSVPGVLMWLCCVFGSVFGDPPAEPGRCCPFVKVAGRDGNHGLDGFVGGDLKPLAVGRWVNRTW